LNFDTGEQGIRLVCQKFDSQRGVLLNAPTHDGRQFRDEVDRRTRRIITKALIAIVRLASVRLANDPVQ